MTSGRRSVIVVSLARLDESTAKVSLSVADRVEASDVVAVQSAVIARLARIDVRSLTDVEALRYGTELTKVFFSGRVGDALRSRLPEDAAVPVFVECGTEDLYAIPWELLLHPHRSNEFVALTDGGSVVRVFAARRAMRAPSTERLASLFVYSSPQGDNLDFSEVRQLAEAFCASNGIDLIAVEDPTEQKLASSCAEREIALVFYSGHAKTVSADGQTTTSLRLQDDTGAAKDVPWASVSKVFRSPPALVVLNACETAGAAGELALAPVAKEVMSGGIDTFIGYRNNARTDMAAVLAREVLTGILGHETFDEMVSRARHCAQKLAAESPHWANYVVYAVNPGVPERLLPPPPDAPRWFKEEGVDRDLIERKNVTSLVTFTSLPFIAIFLLWGLLSTRQTWHIEKRADLGDVCLSIVLLLSAALLSAAALIGRNEVTGFLDRRVSGLRYVIGFLVAMPAPAARDDPMLVRRYRIIELGARMLGLRFWSAAWTWMFGKGVVDTLQDLIAKLFSEGGRT